MHLPGHWLCFLLIALWFVITFFGCQTNYSKIKLCEFKEKRKEKLILI